MNAFQILDKDGNPIPIGSLDKEVCMLTENEEDSKHYCRLGNRKDHKSEMDFIFGTYNWYDTLGWLIASEGYSLKELIEYFSNPFKDVLGTIDHDGELITIERIYPYHMMVLNHWIDQGYQAVQLKY